MILMNLLQFIYFLIILGSEKQKDGTDRVIKFLIEKKPKQWDDLQKKFDPENVYITKYRPELEGRIIKV